ncbi:MAG: hypothetical protein ACE5IO_08955, partial [Thermoplasmata archaeon]
LMGSPGPRVTDNVRAFIDLDRDPMSGYPVGGIGADYMAEVMGFNGQTSFSRLHRFYFAQEKGRNDWNSWKNVRNIEASSGIAPSDAGKLEAKLPWNYMAVEETDVDVVFYAVGSDESMDSSDFVLSNSPGILSLTQESSIPANHIISSSGETRILTLRAKAQGEDITIQSMRMRLIGTAFSTDVDRISLRSSGGDEISSVSPRTNEVNFDSLNILITENQELEFEVDVQASKSSNRTLGAEIELSSDVSIDKGALTLKTAPSERRVGYIGSVPVGIAVDGAFADWDALKENDDPVEQPPGGNSDIDIRSFANYTQGDDVYLFLDVSGEILGGQPIPVLNSVLPLYVPGVLDSDRDTVPDSVDDNPYDFNNDDVPDNQEGGDIDGDGVLDYPAGTDEWLITVIPGNFPPPYAGRSVSIFIGKIEKPMITGFDVARAYIDSDDDKTSGYWIGGLGADCLVEILGRNGEVVSSYVRRYKGPDGSTQWNWDDPEDIGVDVRMGSYSLEAYFDAQSIGFAASIHMVFETSDWKKHKDVATNVGTRSLTRGDYGDYDISFSSRSYRAFFTEDADRVMFQRKDRQLSWELPRAIHWRTAEKQVIIEELKFSEARLDGLAIAYEGVNSAVDVTYHLEQNALKEEIVLSSPPSAPSDSYLSVPMRIHFSSDLIVYLEGEESMGGTKTQRPVTFYERDTARFTVSPPFAVDSREVRVDCEYLFQENGDILELLCPMDWLSEAAYPVILDPTISVYTLENDGTLGQAGE